MSHVVWPDVEGKGERNACEAFKALMGKSLEPSHGEKTS